MYTYLHFNCIDYLDGWHWRQMISIHRKEEQFRRNDSDFNICLNDTQRAKKQLWTNVIGWYECLQYHSPLISPSFLYKISYKGEASYGTCIVGVQKLSDSYLTISSLRLLNSWYVATAFHKLLSKIVIGNS